MNGKYYCNKQGCPGHSSQWEMCPISIPKVDFSIPKVDVSIPEVDISSSIPDVKLPDLNPPKLNIPEVNPINLNPSKLNIPEVKPINLKPPEKHYCGKQNCPGHYVQGQTCINLGDILNQ